MDKITIYTMPTCPKCKVMKMKLDSAGIKFEECQDISEMQKLGIRSAPALLIGPDPEKGKLYKNYTEINSVVNDLTRRN